MNTKNAIVKIKGIKKTYGVGATATHALKGIDLDIYPGELLMIVGPSGSGKTSLISTIAGILDYDEGSCQVLGEELKHIKNISRFRGEKVGFVFQSFNLLPMLSIEENVSVPLVINGTPLKKALLKAEEMLRLVGLKEKVGKMPASLSGGQQQRVAIARSCIHSPSLIVCDEPTSALDHETGQKILDLLKHHFLTKDRALIIVTHDSRIFHYADRIVTIEDGQIMSITDQKSEKE